MFARKNPGEPTSAAMRAALAESSPQLSAEDASLIRREYPNAYTSPSGLIYLNRAPGAGMATPRVGDTVTVNYVGRLLDGTPFDSSFAHGRPLTFQVGMGKVIKGWDEAFLTMKKGAKRTLIVPYWLGYEGGNRPTSVPYHATLVFEVELVDFH
jgi:FKBP-type peptidyl-prolyl cis-trans isomerase